MRALQVQGQDFVAEIQELVSIDDISTKNLLRVQASHDSFDSWQKYAEDECNVGFDRYTQLPFFLTVWVDEEAQHARLMLFSDHFMSDGYSELPLRPSFYDLWLSSKPLSKAFMKGVISFFGKAIFHSELTRFLPVLLAREDQHDFVVPPLLNPTTASFAEGDPTSMKKTLSKCKEENVTFGGAVVCATLLAFYRAAESLPDFDSAQPFKLILDLDYNMRRRVLHPVEENIVGTYVTFAHLGRLGRKGVNLTTTKFWDLARQAKRDIDSKVNQTMPLTAVPIIFDQQINAKIQPCQSLQRGALSVCQKVPSGDTDSKQNLLEVETLHVYNSMPHLGPSAVLWVSSVSSFCYSMGHKCEDDSAKTLFTAFVAVCENIGSIRAEASMADVLEQLEL
ncbi:uncharacterized protein PITG_05277 [Phytophthora infestans T30-4]|uniref:Condensation domain-containing protein n=1 Tax=Phytophthora infestans (strain T30-4) TaxID=403677 RepID=D0N3Z0_PHYIT|nr:uncharacterized protein PITG_05277 [Phytophthora infestans T30-4]EEY69094.1 conserved hypothetical protein [Phytophthora infestans T30-4]|eukprot:XP_002998948.1 conserved hypothetical protein [Phytophthora infestans T30-4]